MEIEILRVRLNNHKTQWYRYLTHLLLIVGYNMAFYSDMKYKWSEYFG